MSGLIALLDDVAAISKVAAASIDDVTGMSMKAGAKAAGAAIDDAAVTPKYIHGFDASRELPIVWKIARGSLFNKVVILTPIALLLSVFAPWAIPPLLMIGGAYLCFEGAEKVWHALRPHAHDHAAAQHDTGDPAHLEEERVRGAIKTDFILSAEIMAIALSTIPEGQSVLMRAAILLVVGIAITVAVYGFVALIVKADDVGVRLARQGGPVSAPLGRGIVRFMPGFMKLLTVVGTMAMIWVGGQIIIHSLHELGWHAPYDAIHARAEAAVAAFPQAPGVASWLVTALFDGIFGLFLGLALMPLATRVINPLIEAAKTALGRGSAPAGAAAPAERRH